MDFALFVDAGHGGISPTSRRYLTPGKRFYHEGKQYHEGGWFYEGVSNRLFAKEFLEMLEAEALPIKVFKTYHDYLDTPLQDRAKLINNYSRSYQKALLISFHHNATSTGKARGFSVWTTPGTTQSDSVAELLLRKYKELLPDHKVLESRVDGDGDFESDFYILRMTRCPAILNEYLFFDNPADCDIIYNDADSRRKYLEACVYAVKGYFNLIDFTKEGVTPLV
jgi:N-acetylmuramoyl-L-alanine amidase